MTKEWYETMQKTSFHLSLKASKKANTFSEDYFRNLYNKEEKAWLKLQEDVSKVKFEDMHPEEFYIENFEDYQMSVEAFEEVKKTCFETREQVHSNFNETNSVFNPEHEKKIFKQALHHNIKYLKSNLPYEILQKVADIRVLALNHASVNVKKEIAIFCKSNDKKCEVALKSYQKEYQNIFKDGIPHFVENFNFHDCKVISCCKRGKDVVLKLDTTGGFTNINQVIFKNCTALKKDNHLYGVWWLYDEIYKTDEGYEIHVLLQGKQLIDFIISTKDVEYLQSP